MASMLSPILSVWISNERRRLVQIVPDPVRQVWDKWDLRASVLISIICHFHLLLLGKSRKNRTWHVKIVWALYLISDWVLLNLSLGIISSKVGEQVGEKENNKQVLLAFWSTILLVHSGGPPTITAEALEDNALWPRTFLLWILQTVRVLYIVLLAWRSKYRLSYFSIGMLLVGFIKCGEKAWAQYYASVDNGHDIEVLTEENCSEGYKKSNLERNQESATDDAEGMDPRDLFENFKRLLVSLFKDFVLNSDDLQRQQSYFRQLDSKRAFQYVKVQLGYAYDVLYTKAYIMFSPFGRLLCACTASIVITLFICFCTAQNTEMFYISMTDQGITWVLVVEVLFQELYTMQAQIATNWNRFTCNGSDRDIYNEDWLEIIKKLKLLTSCLKHNIDFLNSKLFSMKLHLESTVCHVDENLKENVFKYFSTKSNSAFGLLGKDGMNFTIEASGLKSVEWTKQLEFHQSILIWHIVTDLCYHGIDDVKGLSNTVKSKVDTSKDLSEYMLYLLVNQRHMLPIGRGVITFPTTCKETTKFFRQSKIQSDNMHEACHKLLQFNLNSRSKGRSNSALFDACRLARSLINEMETVQRWEFLAAVWMEILGYAATQCRPEQHAQQLRKGGEFLTHAWLLMAHLGLVEQFQVNTAGTPTDSEEQPFDQKNELVQGNTDERVQKPEERIGEEEIVEEHIP